MRNEGRCCDNGLFGQVHDCCKQPATPSVEMENQRRNQNVAAHVTIDGLVEPKPAELPETSKCLPESGKPAAPFIPAPKELKDAAKELLITTKISNKPAKESHGLVRAQIDPAAYDALVKDLEYSERKALHAKMAYTGEIKMLRAEVERLTLMYDSEKGGHKIALENEERYKAALERIVEIGNGRDEETIAREALEKK